MKRSFSEITNRVVYLGFGLLLGLQILQFFAPDPENENIPKYPERIQLNDERLRDFLTQVIRDEIRVQLSGYIAGPPHRANDENDEVSGDTFKDAIPPEKLQQQIMAFEVANRLIDNAISANYWGAETEKQLTQHLGQLTSEQEYEIRVKYSSAINDGLIRPSMPLGLVEIQ